MRVSDKCSRFFNVCRSMPSTQDGLSDRNSKFFGRARLPPSPIGLVLQYQPEQRQEWKYEVNHGSARPLPSQATVPRAATIPIGLGGSLALPQAHRPPVWLRPKGALRFTAPGGQS